MVYERGLTLVHPAHPDAPIVEYPAPASLHVPRAQQRPMTIQLPSLRRAGVRAARLATAMTTAGGDRAVSAAVPAEHRKIAGSEERTQRAVDGVFGPASPSADGMTS